MSILTLLHRWSHIQICGMYCGLDPLRPSPNMQQVTLTADTRCQNRLFLLLLPVRYHISPGLFCASVVWLCICQPWWSHALCGRCLLHCRPCDLCSGCLSSLISLVSLDTMYSAALSGSPVKLNSLITHSHHHCANTLMFSAVISRTPFYLTRNPS